MGTVEDKAAIECLESRSTCFSPGSDWRIAIERVIAISKRAVEDEQAPEQFPQYYESKQPEVFAYARRDSETKYTLFWLDGTPECVYKWTDSDHTRRRYAEAEALARVAPPVTETAVVESPDDWVDLPPEHVLRRNIDWYRGRFGTWQLILDYAGNSVAEIDKQARCRRRDLPMPVEPPKTKRVQVRLWIRKRYLDDYGAAIAVFETQPNSDQDYVEVLPDGNGGFEIEVPNEH